LSQAAASFFSLVDHEVFAITAHTAHARSGMIATWVLPASIQAGYPECLILSSPDNFTHKLIMESRRFVIHLLSDQQSDLLGKLGLSSGRDVDKLSQVNHRLSSSGDLVIQNTCGYAICEVKEFFTLAERVAVIGRVLQQEFAPELQALTKKAAFTKVSPDIRDKLYAKQKEVAARSKPQA